MTRAVRDRILKDVNGNISDHLRNHVHLTNCIHLKNHMHKHSPMLGDRTLMRDLVVLQRSRSLRDPSASPQSWHSPSVVDMRLRADEKDDGVSGRRSIGLEHRRGTGRLHGASPPVAGQRASKAASRHVSRRSEGAAVAAASECSSKDETCERTRMKKEASRQMFQADEDMSWNCESMQEGKGFVQESVSGKSELRVKSLKLKGTDRDDKHLKILSEQLKDEDMSWNCESMQEGKGFVQESVSGKSELRVKSLKLKGTDRDDRHLKILSEQLKDAPDESDTAASSRNHGNQNHKQAEHIAEEAEANLRQLNSLNRAKRRKFRGARRNRPSMATRDPTKAQNEMSVASNSFHQGRAPQRYDTGEGVEEHDDQHISSIPGNGCGIPWNWSRIHHRGKSFLDMAGRSLSCGLSESKLRKGGSTARGMDFPDMPVMSENSSSSTGEALPLLLDASGSQGSIDGAAWFHDYLGELGIFADNLQKQETDSDLASEGRSREQLGFRRQERKRHQNLCQKYMPRTFRDLVGQHLVVQALSNAIAKRKIGLLYLFYGPHGTGKTSCARIFARALNCQSPVHPKPCGNCNSCIAENTGKSGKVREIGPVSKIEFENITELLDHAVASPLESQYRVFIFDECDTLSSECWNAILKVIDRVPRRVVFVLVCSSLDALPHVVISRSQKFFFPKLKDADMIYTLQWIATKEDLDIDKDALKLIASRSDGSLRDAEMTLEQLSLLGKRISLGLVQELVGVISDEKLVDLLDLALSADTVNTVKNLRDIMESGVEPLALMSQLATVITDILAGSFDCTKERPRRKFFRHQSLSKDDMEKLRQALKTLSEAEKQLRMSNDKMTWLTAALLQLAPDQQYILPSSSGDTSFNHSPEALAKASSREQPQRRNADIHESRAGSSRNAHYNVKVKGPSTEGHVHTGGIVSQAVHVGSKDKGQMSKGRLESISDQDMEEIWFEVLEKIPINIIREFMYQEAKLVSVSYCAAPTVQLLFNSPLTKSKAEKFRMHILQAFEFVLGSPVTIEIRCETRKDSRLSPILLSANQDPSHLGVDPKAQTNYRIPMIVDNRTRGFPNRTVSSPGINNREIVEVGDSPDESRFPHKNNAHAENAQVRGASCTQRGSYIGDRNQNLSLVRGKVSLAHVIQKVEGCSQNSGWSKRKAISIAEKLEQENLRLESRSRRLLCWNPPKFTRQKLSRWKIRTRKPRTFLKLISCGRCLSVRSTR